MPTLRVLLPNRPVASHVLTGSRITIGRRPDNIIQILDPSVSAHHAELLLVDDHYRLSDLGSTNWTFVEGDQTQDFHLHLSCKITFGSVDCEYDATPIDPSAAGLSPAEMEKDVDFLRLENQDLVRKIETLQRQIEILSTARLVTDKGEAPAPADAELLKRVMSERDEARYEVSSLKTEIERLRAEVGAVSRERDLALRAREVVRVGKPAPPPGKIAPSAEALEENKGITQRIIFPVPAGWD